MKMRISRVTGKKTPTSKTIIDIDGFSTCHRQYQFDWVKGIAGISLIIFSLIKLVRNEKEAIFIDRCFEEAIQNEVLVSTGVILQENEGKLVRVTGQLRIPSPMEDESYGISIKAAKLKLRVQMYQWTEDKVRHVDDFDDQAYQYRKVWKDKLINSSNFHQPENHLNPLTFPLESQILVNPEVFLGPFLLSHELKNKFSHFTPFTSSQRPQSSQIKMHMGLYYHSTDIWKPTIGDWRVQFSFAGEAETIVSITAKQVGRHLRPFQTLKGNSTAYVQDGDKSYMDMMQAENSVKMSEIWWMRGKTWILTFFGTVLGANAISSQKNRPTVPVNLDSVPFQFQLELSMVPWLTTLGLIWFTRSVGLGIFCIVSAPIPIFLSLKISSQTKKIVIGNRNTG